MPRVSDGADVSGNMKSSGRRVVGQSRGTYGNTNYLVIECFEAEGVPKDTWKAQWNELTQGHYYYTKKYVQGWDTKRFDSPSDLISYPETEPDRTQALELLVEQVRLEGAVDRAVGALEEFKGKPLPDVIKTLIVAQLGARASDPEPVEAQQVHAPLADRQHAADDTDDDDDDSVAAPKLQTRSRQGAADFVSRPDALNRLKGQLVPFPIVTIKNHQAQVVFLVADASRSVDGRSPEPVVERMISMGRQIAMLAWEKFPDKDYLQGACAALVPHKMKVVKVDNKNVELRECWSERKAFVLLRAVAKATPGQPDLHETLLYTYIGGGVPHQPPNTYALVFKQMPVRIAACVAAVGAKLMGIELQGPMVYCFDLNVTPELVTNSERSFLQLASERGRRC